MYNNKMKTIKTISVVILVSSLSFYSALVGKLSNGTEFMDVFGSEAKAEDLVLSNRLVRLEGPINRTMAKYINEDLIYLNSQNKSKIIYMTINSGGGSLMAGRSIIDIMNAVEAPIYCQVVDIAASMAAMILMHCDHKIMLPSAYLLFHQPTVRRPNRMQFREADADLKFIKQYWKELMESTAIKMQITYEDFYTKINNTWTLTALQARDLGFINSVVTGILCKKTIGGCDVPLYRDTAELIPIVP